MKRTVVLIGLVASLGVGCSQGETPADRAGATEATAPAGAADSLGGGEARSPSATPATTGTVAGAVLGYV